VIKFSEAPLRDILLHAEPGWFRPKSYSYCKYRLAVAKVGANLAEIADKPTDVAEGLVNPRE
jgi:hypothetical protein